MHFSAIDLINGDSFLPLLSWFFQNTRFFALFGLLWFELTYVMLSNYDQDIFLKKSIDKKPRNIPEHFFLKIKKCIFNHKHEQTLNVVWRRCSWYCFSQVESSKVTVYKFIINLISNFLQKYIEWWNGLFALIRAIEKETRTER